MTSPITAIVSNVAAQATPTSASNPARPDAHGHSGAHDAARMSTIAAERVGSQLNQDKQRVMKRHEKRAEAGYAPQKSPKRPAAKKNVDEQEPEYAVDEVSGRHVDVEV